MLKVMHNRKSNHQQVSKACLKSEQALRQTMPKNIPVIYFICLIFIDHLGGIIDNHESDVRFGD